MKRIFYFAYGSNLLRQRLFGRIGDWISEQRFVLHNYSLVFNVGFEFSREGFFQMAPRNTVFANIVSAPGESVEGILYEITGEQLKILNLVEGFYVQAFFDVPFDNSIGVVYIGREENICKGRPSLDYLNTILDGCEEHDLTDTFNLLLEYKKQNYKLKKNRHIK